MWELTLQKIHTATVNHHVLVHTYDIYETDRKKSSGRPAVACHIQVPVRSEVR